MHIKCIFQFQVLQVPCTGRFQALPIQFWFSFSNSFISTFQSTPPTKAPGWIVSVKQIKRFPSLAVRWQSSVHLTQVDDGIVQTRTVLNLQLYPWKPWIRLQIFHKIPPICSRVQTVSECNVYDTFATKLKICVYMFNMHEDAEICISKYASLRICSTKYAENMHKMHKWKLWNMQNICLYASIYKNMQSTNMHEYANIHVHIYAKKMQKYAKLNMHKYALLKYA